MANANLVSGLAQQGVKECERTRVEGELEVDGEEKELAAMKLAKEWVTSMENAVLVPGFVEGEVKEGRWRKGRRDT